MAITTEGMGDPVQHAFVYGTLRADYSAAGDHWGVMQSFPGVEWSYGVLEGYGIFQSKERFYPFACPAHDVPSEACEGAPAPLRAVGTLLTWRDPTTFAAAMSRMDPIEGYTPGQTGGLYERAVERVLPVDASGKPVADAVHAYVYYQPFQKGSGGNGAGAVEFFPDGDWLKGRKTA